MTTLREKLIKDLGDDRWKVRDAASQRLRAISWPAVPALCQAVKSPMSVRELCGPKVAGPVHRIQKKFQMLNGPMHDSLGHHIRHHS